MRTLNEVSPDGFDGPNADRMTDEEIEQEWVELKGLIEDEVRLSKDQWVYHRKLVDKLIEAEAEKLLALGYSEAFAFKGITAAAEAVTEGVLQEDEVEG
jgi:hypothetical protein|tara:strand:+ start:3199 stop:3495 length:297 start_codon:yes stop_codon:yes gene_type:complete